MVSAKSLGGRGFQLLAHGLPFLGVGAGLQPAKTKGRAGLQPRCNLIPFSSLFNFGALNANVDKKFIVNV